MPDFLFYHTMRVERDVITGQDVYGHPVKTTKTVYRNAPARFEKFPIRDHVQYRPSGERITNRNIVYIPSSIIVQPQDRIYDTTTGVEIYQGLITDVNTALDSMGMADHYEFYLENP